MSIKEATGEPWSHDLKLTLDIPRYYGVNDEKQKKRSLVFLMVVWVTLFKGAIAFKNSSKGAIWKKVWKSLL